MACCKEASCTRGSPLLLRRGPLSGRWYLVTRYREAGQGIEMQQRHDVSDEVRNQVIALVLDDLLEAGVSEDVLDGVAGKHGLVRNDQEVERRA